MVKGGKIVPRTKGSKNKAKRDTIEMDYSVVLDKKNSEKYTLESDVAALEADINGLKVQLKEKKTVLKKLNKEIVALEEKKRQQDDEILRKGQKEQIENAIQQLLDDGISMDDVLDRLRNRI